MKRAQAAQTLVALALLLPLVLLPVAAYAVEAAFLATRASLLQAAVARSAEDGSQAIDVAVFRSSGVLRLDRAGAARIALESLAAADAGARVDDVSVGDLTVMVRAHDEVPLAFGGILGARVVRLAAAAGARLTPGYLSPSSRVPLPTRSLSMTG